VPRTGGPPAGEHSPAAREGISNADNQRDRPGWSIPGARHRARRRWMYLGCVELHCPRSGFSISAGQHGSPTVLGDRGSSTGLGHPAPALTCRFSASRGAGVSGLLTIGQVRNSRVPVDERLPLHGTWPTVEDGQCRSARSRHADTFKLDELALWMGGMCDLRRSRPVMIPPNKNTSFRSWVSQRAAARSGMRPDCRVAISQQDVVALCLTTSTTTAAQTGRSPSRPGSAGLPAARMDSAVSSAMISERSESCHFLTGTSAGAG
jgi:hypothetical protein